MDDGAAAWAEKIIPIVEKNIPVRRSHAKEVADAGFDSKTEAEKLEKYYMEKLIETNMGGVIYNPVSSDNCVIVTLMPVASGERRFVA